MHETLDNHYQSILDQPIPMLNDLSPREAARTEKELVIQWLKNLDNMEERRARDEKLPVYSSAWIWEELGMRPEKVY